MSVFEISADWIAQEGRNEADATLSSILIKIDAREVTAFVDHKNVVSRKVQIPAYFLAEWIAQNWWPLLWEPRKSEEDADDAAFLSRHSFLAAQHGYALPKVDIVALGKSVQVRSAPREASLANVRFTNRANVTCARELVESQLAKFVTSVVEKLNEARVHDTWLQDTWSLVTETSEDEAVFCRLAGALGLSPYDIDESVAGIIERLSPLVGDRMLMDLCLASSAEQFPVVAKLAEQAYEITRGASASTLHPIEAIKLPQENLGLPAYRRGVQAAELLRKRLKISDLDVGGASRIFELFELDTRRSQPSLASQVYDEVSVTGAVVRNESEMRVGLLQQKDSKRRFAGARAIYSAWSSENLNETRLLTSAVTRDQQANRAFAAEITAPKNFLRSRAKSGQLSEYAVQDLAAELQIGADVVAKQAHNNGIRIGRLN
ncbi:hypothetical protein [Tardiphaga sp. 11_C7_N12_6]|uniref:hypothetical protein n=1 Tax=Tardiphaga sp. 11_C7_N12_6 TaxID=3240789 RepID=UPI003F251787